MKPWTYLINQDALANLLACRAAERWQLLVVFRRIRDHPFGDDANLQDVEGRWLYLRAAGPFVVSYYEDFPVRHLIVVGLRKVPRR